MILLISQLQRFYLIIALIFIAGLLLFALSCLYIVGKNSVLVVHGEKPSIKEKGVYFFFPYTKAKPRRYKRKPFKISTKPCSIYVKIVDFILYDSMKKEFKKLLKETSLNSIDFSLFGLEIIQQ